MGITPDYEVRIVGALLEQIDGPLLQHGLQDAHGKSLALPGRINGSTVMRCLGSSLSTTRRVARYDRVAIQERPWVWSDWSPCKPGRGGFIAGRSPLICSIDELSGSKRPFSMEPGAVFRYTTADGFEVGGLQVGPETSADQVAEAILNSLSDTGLGRDWAYAGWFVELLGLVRHPGCLPIGDAPEDHGGGRRWTFTKNGILIDEPPHVQRVV
jgi:hypothetical protein